MKHKHIQHEIGPVRNSEPLHNTAFFFHSCLFSFFRFVEASEEEFRRSFLQVQT